MKFVESTEETYGNIILGEKTDEQMQEMRYIHACGRSRLNRGATVVEVRSKRFAMDTLRNLESC